MSVCDGNPAEVSLTLKMGRPGWQMVWVGPGLSTGGSMHETGRRRQCAEFTRTRKAARHPAMTQPQGESECLRAPGSCPTINGTKFRLSRSGQDETGAGGSLIHLPDIQNCHWNKLQEQGTFTLGGRKIKASSLGLPELI